jgi:hypothetical protein
LDSTGTQRILYIQHVWRAICEKRGSDMPDATAADFHVMRGWFDRGVPLRVVLGVIERSKKAPSASYLSPAVREAEKYHRRALA